MQFLADNRRAVINTGIPATHPVSFVYCRVNPEKTSVEIFGMNREKQTTKLHSIPLPNLSTKYITCRLLLKEEFYDSVEQYKDYFSASRWDKEHGIWFRNGDKPDDVRFYVLCGSNGVLTYPGSREVRIFYKPRTVKNIRAMIRRYESESYPEKDYRVIMVKDDCQDDDRINVWRFDAHFENAGGGWFREKRQNG